MPINFDSNLTKANQAQEGKVQERKFFPVQDDEAIKNLNIPSEDVFVPEKKPEKKESFFSSVKNKIGGLFNSEKKPVENLIETDKEKINKEAVKDGMIGGFIEDIIEGAIDIVLDNDGNSTSSTGSDDIDID